MYDASFVTIHTYMIKINGKVDKLKTYNGFSSNFVLYSRKNFFRLKFFEFFYILAIEEINKMMVKM